MSRLTQKKKNRAWQSVSDFADNTSIEARCIILASKYVSMVSKTCFINVITRSNLDQLLAFAKRVSSKLKYVCTYRCRWLVH